jgi:hypothetical protein
MAYAERRGRGVKLLAARPSPGTSANTQSPLLLAPGGAVPSLCSGADLRPRCVRQDEGVARIRTQTASGKPTTLREFLLRQDPAWLADELLRIADADPLVAARLKAAAGADRASLVDLTQLRRELDTAILPGGFIEYGAAWGYARGIDSALDQVEELTRKGFPDAAIEAAEHALSLLEEAFDQVDDSDGSWAPSGAVHRRSIWPRARRPDQIRCSSANGSPGGRCARNGRSS